MSYLDDNRQEIFKKYTEEELVRDIKNFINGSGKLTKVLKHFFEEEIYKCKSNRYKETPMDVLQNEEEMRWILDYIASKPKFYNYKTEVLNVKGFFRNGTRFARKVANFDPKNARDVFFKYFDGVDRGSLNCVDTSCGFGSRMSAVLLSGANYYGIDANADLVDKLNECKTFYESKGFLKDNQRCELICQGSESIIEDWVGKMDVSFTSPPYFNLETYANDKYASTQNSGDYSKWINLFAVPTIQNTHKYLKVGGYAMINIKNLTNMGGQKLFDDFMNIFRYTDGFEFVEVFEIKCQGDNKKLFTKNCTYTEKEYVGFKEPVMAFRKVR